MMEASRQEPEQPAWKDGEPPLPIAPLALWGNYQAEKVLISAPFLPEALLLGLTLLVEKFKLQCGCESIEKHIKTAMLAQVPAI